MLLSLNSPGGDVYESMKIGRLLINKKVRTSVNSGNVCASACVLVFAGGVYKLFLAGGGKLAIHRIQFANHEVAARLKEDAYRKLYDQGMDK